MTVTQKTKRNSLRCPSIWVLTAALFCAVMAGSCRHRPSNVLGEDDMVSLMVDMELAEAYASQQSSSNPNYRMELGQRVLATHGVTAETLDTTLAWYGRNLDDYTRLFDKIDVEIERRRLKYTDSPAERNAAVTNLWPYSPHQVLTEKSGTDAIVFSLSQPGVEKGSVMKLSFAMSAPESIRGALGVDYADGSGEVYSTSYNGKNRIEVELHSDSAKDISRLYGSILFKDNKHYPVFLDSISIVVNGIDTLNYQNKRRSQKSYGMIRNAPVKIKEEVDTVAFELEEKKNEESQTSDENGKVPNGGGLNQESPNRSKSEPGLSPAKANDSKQGEMSKTGANPTTRKTPTNDAEKREILNRKTPKNAPVAPGDPGLKTPAEKKPVK